MKLLVRTLMIVAAALVVVGITFALNQSGVLQVEGPERPDQGVVTEQSGTTASESQEFGPQERGERPEGSMGILGAADVLKNLVIVSVIVVIVAGGNAIWKRVRGRLGRNRSPSASKAQAVHQ